MVAVAYVAIVAQRAARLLHHSLRATRSVGLRPFRVASRGHTLYNGHPVLQLAQMRGLPASRHTPDAQYLDPGLQKTRRR